MGCVWVWGRWGVSHDQALWSFGKTRIGLLLWSPALQSSGLFFEWYVDDCPVLIFTFYDNW